MEIYYSSPGKLSVLQSPTLVAPTGRSEITQPTFSPINICRELTDTYLARFMSGICWKITKEGKEEGEALILGLNELIPSLTLPPSTTVTLGKPLYPSNPKSTLQCPSNPKF